jgi:hypothetical protein
VSNSPTVQSLHLSLAAYLIVYMHNCPIVFYFTQYFSLNQTVRYVQMLSVDFQIAKTTLRTLRYFLGHNTVLVISAQSSVYFFSVRMAMNCTIPRHGKMSTCRSISHKCLPPPPLVHSASHILPPRVYSAHICPQLLRGMSLDSCTGEAVLQSIEVLCWSLFYRLRGYIP